MAGGSAKRTAAQNETSIKNLRICLVAVSLLSIGLRLLWSKSESIGTSVTSWFFVALPFIPSIALYRYLVNFGSPRRDTSGALLSPGGDLNQPGIIEWAFDILYITWACQVGSAMLGGWVWWLCLVIPLFAAYKIWSSIIRPFFLQGPVEESNSNEEAQSQSKRQRKLQLRAERGDPRVKTSSKRS